MRQFRLVGAAFCGCAMFCFSVFVRFWNHASIFCHRGLFRLRVDSVLWTRPLGASHAILVFIAADFRAAHCFCLSSRPFRAARQLRLFVVAGFLGRTTIPLVGTTFGVVQGLFFAAAAFRRCASIFLCCGLLCRVKTPLCRSGLSGLRDVCFVAAAFGAALLLFVVTAFSSTRQLRFVGAAFRGRAMCLFYVAAAFRGRALLLFVIEAFLV